MSVGWQLLPVLPARPRAARKTTSPGFASDIPSLRVTCTLHIVRSRRLRYVSLVTELISHLTGIAVIALIPGEGRGRGFPLLGDILCVSIFSFDSPPMLIASRNSGGRLNAGNQRTSDRLRVVGVLKERGEEVPGSS